MSLKKRDAKNSKKKNREATHAPASQLELLAHAKPNPAITLTLRARPRRNRRSPAIRGLVSETRLHTSQLIWPVFIIEGKNQSEPIQALPGVSRYSLDQLCREIKPHIEMGLKTLALFPKIDGLKKNAFGKESLNKDNLVNRALKTVKDKFPELTLITDVALDPYTDHGHDGLVEGEEILNDATVEILAEMALLQAEAGADYVAPSDMMDGRVGAIRSYLDKNGHTNTGILAYTAKYASSFYGPFREAVGAKLTFGDKRTYQMDPANAREAYREAYLDYQEGADILMVKPALPYLDIISLLKRKIPLPIAAYQVSGEYAMIKAAAQNGWLDESQAMMESLLSIRRAGADMILTYFAPQAALWLSKS